MPIDKDPSFFHILLVIALSLIGVLADYFLKLAGMGEKYIIEKWLALGIGIFALLGFGWFFVMKHIKLSELGVIYATTTAVALAIVGVLFFKETLGTGEIIGLVAGLVSILLLGRFI